MDSFVWDDCFVTGIAIVDEQHHRLVDVINRFGELVTKPEGATGPEIEQLFNELASYAQHHFRDEEALMVRSQLDPRHIAKQRDEHARFIQDVTDLHAGVTTHDRSAAMTLLNFLTDWLAYHILGSDQEMARQKAAIDAGATPQTAYEANHRDRDPATVTLLHSLDRLFLHVCERNRALFELNRSLESRVAERTQALTDINQRLEALALTDTLTGLANRRQAMRQLQREWQEPLSRGAPLACMMIDADGFKGVNDTYGHDAGDQVLIGLAQMLKGTVRTDDTVCRLGGDEFLVICPNTPLEGAMRIAEKLRQAVSKMRTPAGSGQWHGSISVGVAVRDESMNTVEDLLKAADDGVYAAKRGGRNCVATVDAPAPHRDPPGPA
jgi:hemerythrin